jgi:hypothetical protein
MASRVEIDEENDNTKGSMWVLDHRFISLINLWMRRLEGLEICTKKR